MCGISGKLAFTPNTRPTEELLKGMARKIAHRGPDGEGFFLNDSIGLAHTRLAIIDRSDAGAQPMSDASKRFTIVYNGEVYNFKDLRKELEGKGIRFTSHTDTEVLVNLYATQGPAFLTKLRGMFAFAIWDNQRGELFCARDRAGQKPFRYYKDKDCFVFASEIDAILADPSVPQSIDWGAIDEFLTHRYIPAPKTGFTGINKLPAGHSLLVRSDGAMTIERYWNIDTSHIDHSLSEDAWVSRIDTEIERAVKEQVVSDVPIGVQLSGGIDSGIVTAALARISPEQIHTFSIGFTDDSHNELPLAREVSKRFNTKHSEFIVAPNIASELPKIIAHYGEPFADTSVLPTWHLAQLTKQHATVVLTGEGGDEGFGGYTRVAKLVNDADASKIQQALHYKELMHCYDGNEQSALYNDTLFTQIKNSRAKSHLSQLWVSSGDGDITQALLACELAGNLPDNFLVKTDIAMMAHGVEGRAPLLDHELLAIAATIPLEHKVRRGTLKYILRRIAERRLPECISTAPKRGFGSPIGSWLRGPLRSFAHEHLLDSQFLAHGFKSEEIERLFDEHERSQASTGHKIWTLLMLKFWLDKYFSAP